MCKHSVGRLECKLFELHLSVLGAVNREFSFASHAFRGIDIQLQAVTAPNTNIVTKSATEHLVASGLLYSEIL